MSKALLHTFIALATAAVFSAGALLIRNPDGFANLFRSTPELDASFQDQFQADALVKINDIRHPLLLSSVDGDPEIGRYVAEMVEQSDDPGSFELDGVFNDLQAKFPGAQYLAANLVMASNRERLLAELTGWGAVGSPDFHSFDTWVFSSGGRLGALGILSRRLEPFSVAALGTKEGPFFNQCPHCQKIHALDLQRDSSTLILSCPDCNRPFDVLASDQEGRWRRANAFFEDFSLPSKGTEPTLDGLVELWQQVADRCDYEVDQGANREREIWKSSRSTWDAGVGDCEDTSILLADILISAGFDARVAIGWNGNIGQHAWVVVSFEGNQYLLESTIEGVIDRSCLSPVASAAPFYQPEQLFDRENLYFTEADPQDYAADYFNEATWKRVPLREADEVELSAIDASNSSSVGAQ